VFRVEPPSPSWLALAIAAGVAAAIAFDLVKLLPIVRTSLWRGDGKAMMLG
jgi:hypothetical protein